MGLEMGWDVRWEMGWEIGLDELEEGMGSDGR